MLVHTEILTQEWFCPECGEENSFSYDVRWHAGQVKDGVIAQHKRLHPGCPAVENHMLLRFRTETAKRED